MARSAEVTFDAGLDTPNLSLDCKYQLDKSEKFTQLSIKKDGQTFLNFDGKAPKFTKVNGIEEVEMKGAGKVTIKNFKGSTFGTFHCVVFYKKNKKESFASQKRKLSFRKKPVPKKCVPEWKEASAGNYPSDLFIAGTDKNGASHAFCRLNLEDTLTPGMADSNLGCIITWNGGTKIAASNFEVLTGTGFQWAKQSQGSGTPTNSYQAGKDSDPNEPRPIFAGRCNVDGLLRVGKIDFSSKMYYTLDGQSEQSNCEEPHEILICNQ